MTARKQWRSAYAVELSSYRRPISTSTDTPKVGGKDTGMSCIAPGYPYVISNLRCVIQSPGEIRCKDYFLRFQAAGQGQLCF